MKHFNFSFLKILSPVLWTLRLSFQLLFSFQPQGGITAETTGMVWPGVFNCRQMLVEIQIIHGNTNIKALYSTVVLLQF